MYSIEAIYNEGTFKPVQPIYVKEPHKVIITFVEPLENAEANDIKVSPRSKVIGMLKDKVWISDDFNEPLEEFEEYM